MKNPNYFGRIEFNEHAFELLKLHNQGVTLEQWATAVQRMSTGVAEYPVCQTILDEAKEYRLKKSDQARKAGLASGKTRTQNKRKRATGVNVSQHESTDANGTQPNNSSSNRNNNRSISNSKNSTDLASGSRPRNEIWDSLCLVFKLNPVTKSEQSRIGKLVSVLRAKGANKQDVEQRAHSYADLWGRDKLTPEALVKHWDRFAPDNLLGQQEENFQGIGKPVSIDKIRKNTREAMDAIRNKV